MSTPTFSTTSLVIGQRLRALEAERALANLDGSAHLAYLSSLEREISEYRAAYVGAAVTEIATLRAALAAPLQG